MFTSDPTWYGGVSRAHMVYEELTALVYEELTALVYAELKALEYEELTALVYEELTALEYEELTALEYEDSQLWCIQSSHFVSRAHSFSQELAVE